MRRRVVLIASLMLLGAITTIAIVASCACFWQPDATDPDPGCWCGQLEFTLSGTRFIAGWPATTCELEWRPSADSVGQMQLFIAPGLTVVPDYWIFDHGPPELFWSGFALDTAFYAIAWWALLCGPFALRRVIRRRRELCAVCGYPTGVSPVCTECGKPVKARSVEPASS